MIITLIMPVTLVQEGFKMSVRVRGCEDRDVKKLVRLFNAAWKENYEFMPLTEDDVRERMNLDKSIMLLAEDEGRIVGSATYSDGYWGEEIRWIAVADATDPTLVKDALRFEVEKRVKGASVFTMVDSESSEIRDWIEKGYAQDGGLYQLVARLDQVRLVPPVPDGIALRNMASDEEADVVSTVDRVFGWERLKPNFVERGKIDSPPFDETWVQVAELGGKMLSVVVAWPAVKFNHYFGAKRGYLGPAATVPEFRSKKLASALTVRALNVLFQNGISEAVLHTSERNLPSVNLLKNIGFEVMHDFKFLRKNI